MLPFTAKWDAVQGQAGPGEASDEDEDPLDPMDEDEDPEDEDDELASPNLNSLSMHAPSPTCGSCSPA